jgi:hypothetical protein
MTVTLLLAPILLAREAAVQDLLVAVVDPLVVEEEEEVN